MRAPTPDERLLSVAGFVRQGAVFADVGTDHALLPLWLLSEGRIIRAVCSDINEGPLNSARENARRTGLSDKVSFYLTDGAAALSCEGITDLAIAGMGGELISGIIERAPYLKNPNIRLILQAMSKQDHLRRYLAASGFSIEGEVYSSSQGKHYVTFCVHFSGISREISEIEANFGEKKFHTPPTESAKSYFSERIRAMSRRANGLIESGKDARDELMLIDYAKGVITK